MDKIDLTPYIKELFELVSETDFSVAFSEGIFKADCRMILEHLMAEIRHSHEPAVKPFNYCPACGSDLLSYRGTV